MGSLTPLTPKITVIMLTDIRRSGDERRAFPGGANLVPLAAPLWIHLQTEQVTSAVEAEVAPIQPLGHSQVEPIINKHMPTWKKRRVSAGLRQAAVAMETSQPYARLFPDALIILWLMKPRGVSLSLYLWKPSKWAHYDESRSKREWLHTFSIHHHTHFLSLLLPEGEENKTTLVSERSGWRTSRYDNRRYDNRSAPKGKQETTPSVHHSKCLAGQMGWRQGSTSCLT